LKIEFQKYDPENTGSISRTDVQKILDALELGEGDKLKVLSALNEEERVTFDFFCETVKAHVKIDEVDSIEKIQD